MLYVDYTFVTNKPTNMKSFLFFAVLLTAFSACQTVNAQSKDSSHAALVAPVIRQPNDSTPLLTYKDFQELANLIQEYPAKYANPITQWLQARFQLRAQEYALKPKK
jgi:hypothetical protein